MAGTQPETELAEPARFAEQQETPKKDSKNPISDEHQQQYLQQQRNQTGEEENEKKRAQIIITTTSSVISPTVSTMPLTSRGAAASSPSDDKETGPSPHIRISAVSSRQQGSSPKKETPDQPIPSEKLRTSKVKATRDIASEDENTSKRNSVDQRPSKSKQASKNNGDKSPTQKAPTIQGQTSGLKTETKTSSKSSLSSANIIGTHYKVGKKIGEGSFGVIYEGLNMLNNVPIAIKFEPRKSDAPQLRDEYKTYRLLANSIGIPSAYYFGQEGLHNVLCIDLLGPSLEDMFDLCHRKFSIKTVCMVAKQMITRAQTLHEKNLIYRDIKPDNFLIGRLSRHELTPILQSHSASHPHSASMVYMVDFGMAKQYRDPKTKAHIPYREKKSLSGTARYMSINTHLGREQSRRDDLEALGHVFFYFLRGSLPWQGLKAATNKQKYEKIGEKKQSTPIKELCESLPDEFSVYQNYVRDLKFDAEPDYEYLRGLLNKVLAKNGFIDDGVYDWMIELDHQKNKKERQRESKKPEASTAAIAHQSTAEGLTPVANETGEIPSSQIPVPVNATNLIQKNDNRESLVPNERTAARSSVIKENGGKSNNIVVSQNQPAEKESEAPKGNKEASKKEEKGASKKAQKLKTKTLWEKFCACCAGGSD
ncbi:casein kinase I [Physocladia obscura]|uniref:non-specific serine/threonine protein kinase n=1 Tax=Physocladia obscura TaxID=109957 RepID=A0AAD5SYC1_9FUNG|nr:casein kinase I [Physocladia obscura]